MARLLRFSESQKDSNDTMKESDKRVLIIEDDDVLRVMLFTILRHQPLSVDTAATADEALQKVSTCDYSLILIDIHLPNNESTKFLEQFREQRPEATSFVLAVRDPRQDVTIDSAVVSAVLNKPLEIDTLAEVVRECAQVVPAPHDPLPCPAAESDIRADLDRRGNYYSN